MRSNKYFLINFLFFSCFYSQLFSQKFVTYQYQARYHSNNYNTILLMDGKGNSLYEKYPNYLNDLNNYSNGIKQIQEPNAKTILADQRDVHEYRIIKTSGLKQIHIGAIASVNYTYTDSIHLFEWKLISDQDSIIAGYACKKAECNKNGRIWTAWYAPDIPISEGPYKFNGLPGLITTVYDSKNQFKIDLFYFKKQDVTLTKIDISKYVPITKKSYQKHKTDFLDNYLEYLKGNVVFIPNLRTHETIDQKWEKRPLSIDEVL